MAFYSQEMKSKVAPKVKAILNKYGLKGSLSVRSCTAVVLTIKSGKIDFIGNSNEVCGRDSWQVHRGFKPNTHGYDNVNNYHFRSHYDGVARDCIEELLEVLNEGNHDNSDITTDYFDVGFYVDINIGRWNKPYIFTP